jgi:hypothetical protein
MAAESTLAPGDDSVLNLPPEPGTTGYALLVLGLAGGLALLALGRGRAAREDRVVGWIVLGALAVTVAGAPYTLWRVLVDIRETAPLTPAHAEYVGAETKLIDGELVRRVEAQIPLGDTYYVRVAPDAYSEIRTSLALWLGYELMPRRQARQPEDADWIVTWGAPPAELGLDAGSPHLVGRNRLSEREPVYVARGTS